MSGAITITADSRCAWQATATASWVTITSIPVGIGNGTVSYTVAGGAGRKATITIGGRVFAIKQK